ncbi:MAG: transcriptional regulator, partial [Proteobacteria bacterium]
MTEQQRFNSVWDAISDTPQESLNLKLRSQLMDELTRRIDSEKWSQSEAAKRLGVTQPRISDLV